MFSTDKSSFNAVNFALKQEFWINRVGDPNNYINIFLLK